MDLVYLNLHLKFFINKFIKLIKNDDNYKNNIVIHLQNDVIKLNNLCVEFFVVLI